MTPDHEYVWKEKFLLERDNNDELRKNEDLGILGITVHLHLKGREDLVIKVSFGVVVRLM